MDWITEQIAIGNYLEAQDAELLREQAISSILGLTPALRGIKPTELGVREIEIISLDDGPGNDPRLFRIAVETLTRLATDASPVLVHCHAGRSRSAVVVAGYLMQAQGLDVPTALAAVRAKRETAVSEGLERLLEGLE